MYTVKPRGVCSKEIRFEIENRRIRNVKFLAGCPGNLQAVAILVEGMDAEEAAGKLRGILCQNGTSCPDQLARAIECALQEEADRGNALGRVAER